MTTDKTALTPSAPPPTGESGAPRFLLGLAQHWDEPRRTELLWEALASASAVTDGALCAQARPLSRGPGRHGRPQTPSRAMPRLSRRGSPSEARADPGPARRRAAYTAERFRTFPYGSAKIAL